MIAGTDCGLATVAGSVRVDPEIAWVKLGALVEVSGCAYWPRDALPRPISDFTVRRVRDALSATSAASFVIVPPRQWFE